MRSYANAAPTWCRSGPSATADRHTINQTELRRNSWNGTKMDPRQIKSSFAGLASLAGGLALAGCVTINIYFPAAAAEKAADRIIDEVWQLKEGGAPTTVKPVPGESK
jgi:hypothetical protein